jgi:peptidyl-prolyl cis-trans isomerase D
MLQAIRSKATSFVVKILFALLIVTFGVWGIGDIFRSRSTDTTVATVGDRAITIDQVATAVRSDMQRLQSAFGGTIDAAQAKQLGVVDNALQRIVGGELVDLEIDRLHLAVGDEAVRQAILANPAFRNQQGVFDRSLYQAVLANSHLSEPQFEAQLREDMLRGELTSAITEGWTPPKELTDALYRTRFERRTADTVTLPPAAAGAIPAPTEDQLDAFYKSHQDDFRTPELRSFKLATLTLDDLAAGITVPEDKLKQEYEARKNELGTAEERQLQQMLLPDETKAKDAEAQLAAGKDFAEVAKSVAGEEAGALDLGWVKRADLPEELGNAAFAVKTGETTQPLQTSFGWHILRLVAIKPAEQQSFDQAKAKLAQDLARDEAGDKLADAANHIDDALAGGASLTETAQKFGMKTIDVADVDNGGHDAAGKTAELPKAAADILRAAFATASGQTSELTQMGEDGYFIVAVDKVTPAAVKPLAQVHDDAVKLWQADERSAALAKAADAIAAEVNSGRSLKDIAAERKLALATTKPVLRTGGDHDAPPALVAKLFEAKPGQAVTAPAGDSVMIAQVTAIEPADPTKDAAAVLQLAHQLGQTMQNDLLSEFDQALRRQFPVEVNQTNLDRVL